MHEGYVDIEGWGGTRWIPIRYIPTKIEGWGGDIGDGGTQFIEQVVGG